MLKIDQQTPEVQEKIKKISETWTRWNSEICDILLDLLKQAESTHNSDLEAFCHARLARYYYTHSQLDKFLSHLKIGLPLQQAAEDRESLSISYNLLGIDAMNHANYPIAMDNFLNTLQNSDEDSTSTGTSYINIGHIYYEIGELDQAIKFCKRGRLIYEKVAPSYNLRIALSQEAMYNAWVGNLEESWNLIQKSENLQISDTGLNPQNVSTDIYEAKIFYYDAKGDIENRNANIRHFIDALDGSDETIDFSEDIIWVCDLLLEHEDTNLVADLLNVVNDAIMASDITHIKVLLIEAWIKYYTILGEDEKRSKIMMDYFWLGLEKKKEDTDIYRVNIDLRLSMEELRQKQIAIENENRRLLYAASTDGLTGIANRALYSRKSEELIEYARKNNYNFGVEMIDVDYFKEFNDTYGHGEGDKLLQHVGSLLKRIEDENTFVARYGGDEFIVLYVNQTDEEILKKSNFLKDEIANLKIPHEKSPVSDYATISQGIRNSAIAHNNQVWDFAYAADQALYHVKQTKKGEIYLIHHSKEI